MGPIGGEEIGKMLDIREGMSYLDIGCGPGTLLQRFDPVTHARKVGIDPWKKVLSAARERIPSADVMMAGGEHLPFTPGSFDRATAAYVLEHIADQEEVMTEIGRVLRPQGRIVIASPNAISPYGLFVAAIPSRLRNSILSKVGSGISGSFSFDDETVHYRNCSARRMTRTMRSLGFQREQLVWSTGTNPIRGSSRLFGTLFGAFWRVLEAVGRKRPFAWVAPQFFVSFKKVD